MSVRAKRPVAAVRFELGPLPKNAVMLEKKTAPIFQNTMKDTLVSLPDIGRDSGAPSPDYSSLLQPASLRLLHNQTRMDILSTINSVLASRAEHESSRSSLSRLHDELRARLASTTRACFAGKLARLEQARAHVRQLSAERRALEGHAARARDHLAQHEREHAGHAVQDEDIQVALPNLKDKRPSRKADQKLAAGRVLREVLQLRNRLAALERRIQVEARKKKQAEEELAILRAAVARNKGKTAERSALKPLLTSR